MVATPTPRKPDRLEAALQAAWLAVEARRADHGALRAGRPDVWAVACSGGRDSLALAHAAARLAHARCGAGRPTEVVALHVHHGLNPGADAWVDQVQAQVNGWAREGWPVRLVVRCVNVEVPSGSSLEERARAARHAALQSMALAAGAVVLWLAHHQRDQAETFLLQGLRGGGVRGLAAMPVLDSREGLFWGRPWLAAAPEDIQAHVDAHGLQHVDDDSNRDVRWARNRLRHEVWPGLSAAFPQAEQALAKAASHVADTLPILTQWAQANCCALAMVGPEWPLSGWAARPVNERRLLLSHWYREVSGCSLPATWVHRLADEWPLLDVAARPWLGAELGLSLYRGRVSWVAALPLPGGGGRGEALAPPDVAPVELDVAGPGDYPLPGWGLVLQVREASVGTHGLSPAWAGRWRVQARRGGEQWQAHTAGPARALKKQFQALGVPPWARAQPLVWRGDALLWVPCLGVDARRRAEPGAPAWVLALALV